MKDTYLQRTSINVTNIKESESFYKNVLNFSKIYHKTIPLNKLKGYPVDDKNKNGNLELMMLSQGVNKPMLGLMKITPVHEERTSALVFYTSKIQYISKNFKLYGGNITMSLRDGESFDFKTNKVKPSLVIMGTDLNNHFIEVIQFKGG